jgi:predicted Kef-type K+ transport protein
METLFSSIDYKDPIWIAIAFIFGLLSRWIGLPPLVGFLVAGFSLNYLGAESGFFLKEMADLGVTLLLFGIGLKLRVKELFHAEVWGVTLINTLLVCFISTMGVFLFKEMGLPLFIELDMVSVLIIGFSLSFSSTVFVVKILEDRGDLLSVYGRLAIGVLIVQDLFAVIFLAISEAKIPSVSAAFLISLIIIARPILVRLLSKVGHGELLVLYGLVLALGGASLFEAVDLKADLGALFFGILLANNPKSQELAKALFSIKELFLVGFFLSIGMAGLPTAAILITVALFITVLVFKSIIFFLLFTRFRVRSRPATAASLALGNYSEFGLIVSAVAVSHELLSHEWMVVMAVLVACSFAVSSAANKHADVFYSRFRNRLQKFQHAKRLVGDEDIDLTGIHILICGMGRVGSGAFDHIIHQGQKNVLGLDFDEQVVARQCKNGRKANTANVSSPDFWSRLDFNNSDIEWILLCSPNMHTNSVTANLARRWGFKGFISATTHYPDEEETLRQAGVDAVFNIYAEAGVGLAQHSEEIISSANASEVPEVNTARNLSESAYKPPFG